MGDEGLGKTMISKGWGETFKQYGHGAE